MANFTPGPYCDNGDGCIRQAEQNEGHRLFIAQVIEIPFNFGGDKVTEANINLFKAAPEMYAALKAAEWGGHIRERFCPVCRRLDFEEHKADCLLANALAKADGKQAANG